MRPMNYFRSRWCSPLSSRLSSVSSISCSSRKRGPVQVSIKRLSCCFNWHCSCSAPANWPDRRASLEPCGSACSHSSWFSSAWACSYRSSTRAFGMLERRFPTISRCSPSWWTNSYVGSVRLPTGVLSIDCPEPFLGWRTVSAMRRREDSVPSIERYRDQSADDLAERIDQIFAAFSRVCWSWSSTRTCPIVSSVLLSFICSVTIYKNPKRAEQHKSSLPILINTSLSWCFPLFFWLAHASSINTASYRPVHCSFTK